MNLFLGERYTRPLCGLHFLWSTDHAQKKRHAAKVRIPPLAPILKSPSSYAKHMHLHMKTVILKPEVTVKKHIWLIYKLYIGV